MKSLKNSKNSISHLKIPEKGQALSYSIQYFIDVLDGLCSFYFLFMV